MDLYTLVGGLKTAKHSTNIWDLFPPHLIHIPPGDCMYECFFENKKAQ